MILKFENVAALLGSCLTYEFDSVRGSIILSELLKL